MTTVFDCSLLTLPRIASETGALTPVYGGEHVPFDIARVYYLYDVPGGESRGGHAHLGLQQLIVAASGSFEVIVDDGRTRRSIFLNRPYHGLYVPTMIWRELVNFSSGGICLVLASMRYTEDDYIRDYADFQEAKQTPV